MPLLKPTRHKKLLPQDLKYIFNPKIINNKVSKNDTSTLSIIGQERAIKALRLGVELRKQGYNIFVTGLSGTGKTSTVKTMLQTLQPDCEAMNDYAYVHNFDDPDSPTLLKFKRGEARRFRKDLLRSIGLIQDHISTELESDDFENKRKLLLVELEKNKSFAIEPFQKKIKKDRLAIGQVNERGAIRLDMLAIVKSKAYPLSELPKLLEEKLITKKQIETLISKYQSNQVEFNRVVKNIILLGKKYQEDLENIEQDAVADIIQLALNDIKLKYRVSGLAKYLKLLANDILTNLAFFKKGLSETTEQEYDYLRNYNINIILNSSIKKDCPVIVETTPTYQSLFGSIEKYSDGEGGWFSDYKSVKAGAILKANGGYLILNAEDTFAEPGVWKALKRALYYRKLEIQDKHSSYQSSPSTLKPEPIEISTKIILIGSDYTYSMLSAYENDFKKIFKVKAEFDSEMRRTEIGVSQYIEVLDKLISVEKLKEFNSDAIAKILEYSARFTDSKNKLTTRFSYLLDLAREADFWASDVGAKIVTDYHVKQAYNSARERHGLYETKVNEMFNDGTMMIDTKGSRIGQINGLAVYGGDAYSFGKPTRITATVALGNGSIVNVEREAGLSGNTHNKGVLVITGYLKGKFGKNIPLSFNASLVFEQGYGMIDGDSASITEIAALLSAITQIPIKQNIAITGSVNQKGDIQPIGGVNDKIEGFFDLCSSRGLTGKESVIIPVQNVQDLMLKDEVVEAVKNKKFNIYSVSKVEDALELLMGVRAGKLLSSGHYQANTIFGEVEKKLREMRRRVVPHNQQKKELPTKKTRTKKK